MMSVLGTGRLRPRRRRRTGPPRRPACPIRRSRRSARPRRRRPGSRAISTPRSASSGARPAVRFQAVTGKPARAMFAAIAAPIVPSPRNATRSIAPMVRGGRRPGPARTARVAVARTGRRTVVDDGVVLRLAFTLFAVQAGFHGFTASLPVALTRAGVPDPEIGLIVGRGGARPGPGGLRGGRRSSTGSAGCACSRWGASPT